MVLLYWFSTFAGPKTWIVLIFVFPFLAVLLAMTKAKRHEISIAILTYAEPGAIPHSHG